MPIIKQKEWDKCVSINQDPYGKCCIDVARKAMEILDNEPDDFDCHSLICRADDEIDAGGITGFMAGCVAQMISELHSRGEEFRKKWNKEHGIKEENDKGGVVNPALFTINA